VQSMDGYLRPGCVHLTVQALLDGVAAAVLAAAAGGEQQQQQEHAAAAGGGEAPAPVAPAAAASASPPAAPAAAAAAPAGGCCGRKRAAEAPAEPAGHSASAVNRVVERMLQSGAHALQLPACLPHRVVLLSLFLSKRPAGPPARPPAYLPGRRACCHAYAFERLAHGSLLAPAGPCSLSTLSLCLPAHL
jgi:hypothetical protein